MLLIEYALTLSWPATYAKSCESVVGTTLPQLFMEVAIKKTASIDNAVNKAPYLRIKLLLDSDKNNIPLDCVADNYSFSW